MNREQAIEVIRTSELAADADWLIAELRRSIRIRARRATQELALGESRLGGSPDLPRGFDWPRYSYLPKEWDARRQEPVVKTPRKEEFLHFIAQLRLDDFRNLDTGGLLPTGGWLCFFYDLDQQPWGFDPDQGIGWRVIYLCDDPSGLVRTNHPQPEPQLESEACKLSYSLEWTLPPTPFRLEKNGGSDESNAHFFEDWQDEIKEILEKINGPDRPFEAIHRILGHPEQIQNDMRLECQLASNGLYYGGATPFERELAEALTPGAKDWRLLLQIDTDEEGPGWMWGDCGRIYYWIKDADMRRREFEKSWLVLQCS